jgi:ribosomal protein L7/L12
MQDQLKINQAIQTISKSNGKIAAIKYCKQSLNMGLAEAKDYVEALLGQSPISFSENSIEFAVQIKQLIAENRKLEAIKLHKETMDCDLKTSVDYVNKIINPNYLKQKRVEEEQSFTNSFSKSILSFIVSDWIKPLIRFFTGDKA